MRRLIVVAVVASALLGGHRGSPAPMSADAVNALEEGCEGVELGSPDVSACSALPHWSPVSHGY